MKWFSSGKGRSVAALTLMAFLITNLIPTDAAYAFFQEIVPSPASVASAGLSPQIGKVKLSFFGGERSAPVIIYHIQDAHASAEAQENIFKILSFLHEKKQLDEIFLEGATSPLSAKSLNPFKDAAKNKEFRDRLFQQGLINGSAKFLGENPGVLAFGVEDPLLYRQNLDTYRTLFKAQPAIHSFLNSAEVSLIEDTKKITNAKSLIFLKS